MTPPIDNSVNYQEAYIREILSEVILLQKKLTEIGGESQMRIGITQDIINTHLNHAAKALDHYTQAANAHFSVTKKELKDIADNEVKASITKSLLDAHHKLLLANPPRIALQAVLMMTVVAAMVGGIIGLSGGYIAYHAQNTDRLSVNELQLIEKERLLEQSFSTLSPATQQELEHVAINFR
jgi:hypothetical protein